MSEFPVQNALLSTDKPANHSVLDAATAVAASYNMLVPFGCYSNAQARPGNSYSVIVQIVLDCVSFDINHLSAYEMSATC